MRDEGTKGIQIIKLSNLLQDPEIFGYASNHRNQFLYVNI